MIRHDAVGRRRRIIEKKRQLSLNSRYTERVIKATVSRCIYAIEWSRLCLIMFIVEQHSTWLCLLVPIHSTK